MEKPLQLVLLIFFMMPFLSPSSVWGTIEIGGRYGLDRKVYGIERENKLKSETVSGFLSVYFFSTTALEFSLSQSKDTTLEREDVTIDANSNLVLDELTRVVETEVRSVGIKQMLGSPKWPIQPLISIGYAKQIITGSTIYKLNSNGTIITTESEDEKQEYDSTYGSFTLKILLGKSVSLSGTVRTLFQDSDYDDARNNVKYLVGLSIRL